RARSFRHRIAREKEIFRSFALGQSPATLFITCSDSRVVPTLITAAAPGELFELRNAGNIVPPYRPGYRTGEAATIEYAVEVLKVRDIIVCGHSHCGAVGAVARGEDLTHLPSVA
ncbi:carbonic anhydrase, partial [Streptomyces xanthophaeus]